MRLAHYARIRWCLSAGRGLPPAPTSPTPLLPAAAQRHHLTALREALADELCGVWVLWAPPGTGKSTLVGAAMRSLQADKGHPALLLDPASASGDSSSNNGGPIEWMREQLGLRNSSMLASSLLMHPGAVGRHTLLAVDHVERLPWWSSPPTSDRRLESLVTHLAEASVYSKRLSVLLVTEDAACARRILSWNGGQKFRRVDFPVWNEGQMYAFLAHHLATHARQWTVHERARLGRLAVISRNPRFVEHLCSTADPGYLASRAAVAEAHSLRRAWAEMRMH